MPVNNASALQNASKSFKGSVPNLAGRNTATYGANVITGAGFVLGTASQLTDTTRNYNVYLQFATAGTALTVAIGPTSAVPYKVVSNAVCPSGEVVDVTLPAGWFMKVTVTTSTLARSVAISS
jgi:hypothetical protein